MSKRARKWKMCDPAEAWAVKWRSGNRLNGETAHLIREPYGVVKQFRTRKEARDWALEKYGYIDIRADLQAEPHGWRMPEIIRVEVRELRKARK